MNTQAAEEALIRGMIWLLVVWLISAWVGWFARQRNAVLSLMPCIFLMADILSYSEYRIEALWTIVVILLLLMGIWNYRNHTWQWEKHRVDYSDSIRYDLGQAVVLLSLVIGALAFFTPSISWREIRDYWRNRDQTSDNRTAENLGIQKPCPASQSAWEQKPSLPREHLLSGGYAQTRSRNIDGAVSVRVVQGCVPAEEGRAHGVAHMERLALAVVVCENVAVDK